MSVSPSSWRCLLKPTDALIDRHLGPSSEDIQAMLKILKVSSLHQLIHEVIPSSVRYPHSLTLEGLPADAGLGEYEALARMRAISHKNQVFRSFLGMGYSNCFVPPVIQRNVLEDPGWNTPYTPYQAEISQGRLEALLNFQTMVSDLTGLPVANASLLDEATAAAEAMAMCYRGRRQESLTDSAFFVSSHCHPQTIHVVQTRAQGVGIQIHVGDEQDPHFNPHAYAGVLWQYPGTEGYIGSPQAYASLAQHVHAAGGWVVVAADLLALTLLQPPGAWGADVVVGSAQRFGTPLGYGGPHAAYLATHEAYKRLMPGRLIGVSKDAQGRMAYRMALQTREQHIRRDKATSNLCTSQALLAIMASMYGIYHGPTGLVRMARRIHTLTLVLAAGLRKLGYQVNSDAVFDTLYIEPGPKSVWDVHTTALQERINLRIWHRQAVGVSLDETTSLEDIFKLWRVFAPDPPEPPEPPEPSIAFDPEAWLTDVRWDYPSDYERTDAFMTHPVFNSYHTEHGMLRYVTSLRHKDLSLAHAMIPLGSCTMKLNATSALMPVSWANFSELHPYAPVEQAAGYQEVFASLASWLEEITGFAAVSFQPNAGSQGEYTGLRIIRAYHESRQHPQRTICLVPTSAHGTNPASAVMAGFEVLSVTCDKKGYMDRADLHGKLQAHSEQLGALMITYPSTYGIFEEGMEEICHLIHRHGGQVYLDGANMNAQVGLCRPGDYGADVCHLNLHKTFCIPHGGGGPGMGPIAVASHLAAFLPGHPMGPASAAGTHSLGAVSAAPWGSASLLPICWMYMAMMGAQGLRRASQTAVLNANYMAHQLKPYYPILFTGAHQRVAHEFIVDVRPFKIRADVNADDVAKRLMDYGFHAPTLAFPVAGTLMVEPTESESKAEMDRFCEAMRRIRLEIAAVEQGRLDRCNNPLKQAPHPAEVLVGPWDRPYSRQEAVFPAPWVCETKFWPPVSRIDNAWGDRYGRCVRV